MKQLPALKLTGSTRLTRICGRLLILAFLIVTAVVLLAPWQQFVKGSGKVIAFNPLDRRISVEAPVSGRVKKLPIVEGQRVVAGQLLAVIEDNDPNLLENLNSQRLATNNRINFAKSRIEALNSQIQQQKLAKAQALDSARQKVSAAKIASQTAELEFVRVSNLFEKGLASRREHEQAILRRDSTAADYLAAQANLKQTGSNFDSSIASIQASQESAKSDQASAERDLTTLDISVSQNERQQIKAPRDGIVLTVPVTDGSYLKPGDQICIIIPETESRFVEVWVNGNDVALITARSEEDGVVTPGDPVRIAFEGWPAIQSVGWPQLAVGTFGGEVAFVDTTDDGTGRFRIVIAPTTDVVDRGDGQGPVEVDWPSGDRWLRQGVRTKAWVLLDEVPLWFELWRQINGFPPIGRSVEPNPTT